MTWLLINAQHYIQASFIKLVKLINTYKILSIIAFKNLSNDILSNAQEYYPQRKAYPSKESFWSLPILQLQSFRQCPGSQTLQAPAHPCGMKEMHSEKIKHNFSNVKQLNIEGIKLT